MDPRGRDMGLKREGYNSAGKISVNSTRQRSFSSGSRGYIGIHSATSSHPVQETWWNAGSSKHTKRRAMERRPGRRSSRQVTEVVSARLVNNRIGEEKARQLAALDRDLVKLQTASDFDIQQARQESQVHMRQIVLNRQCANKWRSVIADRKHFWYSGAGEREEKGSGPTKLKMRQPAKIKQADSGKNDAGNKSSSEEEEDESDEEEDEEEDDDDSDGGFKEANSGIGARGKSEVKIQSASKGVSSGSPFTRGKRTLNPGDSKTRPHTSFSPLPSEETMALEQLVTNKIPSPKQLTSLTRSFAALRKSIGIDAKNRRAVSASFLPKASVQLSQLPSPLQTASQAQKLKMHSTILSKTETPKVVWTPSNPANTEAQRRSWITSNASFKDPINENTNHSSSLGWSRKDSTCVRWSVRQAPTSTRAGSLAETNIPYDQSGGDRKIEFSQIDHCKSSAQKPLVRRFSYLNGKRRSSQMDRHNKTFFVWPTPIPVRMKEPELPTLCPREVRRRAGLARLIQSGECLSGRIRFFCGQLDGMGQHLRVASEEEEIGWRVIARIGVAASQSKKRNFLSKEDDIEAEVESLTEDETDSEKGMEKEKKSDENQWDLQMLDQMFNEIKMSAACSIDGTNSYLSQD